MKTGLNFTSKGVLKIVTFLLLILSFTESFAQNKFNQELQIQTDNDLLTFKRKLADRYYSFGMHFDYRKVVNEKSKLFIFSNKKINNLKKIIINWHAGIEGYTSDKHRDIKKNGVFVAFDRPYAGWSFLSNKIAAVNNKTLYFTKLTLGVLGPISGAEKLQNSFHKLINSPKFPEWKNQIQNEVAGNIALGINHLIIGYKYFDIYSESSLSLGTQATFFRQGFIARFGIFNTIDNSFFYHTNLNNENKKPKSEFYIDFGAHGTLWGYKATIQGRVFGDNVNMNTDGLNSINADISASINYAISWFTIFYTHHLITAETYRERHFYYGSIGLLFKF